MASCPGHEDADVREADKQVDRRVGRSIIVACVVLAAAGTALAFAARGAGPLPGDLLVARLLQGLPGRGGLVGALLFRADIVVWPILATALAVTLLLRRWSSAGLVFLASLTGLLTGIALKRIVVRPRPPAELVRVLDAEQGYGFPSTTACLSVVRVGVVVYLVWRAPLPRPIQVVALGAALVSILVIGVSLVYAGEHWPSDVLGGWLFGTAWLIALTRGFVRAA
jgi:undecaprenyl-diphosphatase